LRDKSVTHIQETRKSVTKFLRNGIFAHSQERVISKINLVRHCRFHLLTAVMDKKKRVHLFNCDKTYDLLMVEALLRSVGDKLPFTITISKHYFSLQNMSEICENTISRLTIDFAFFVVHANESRLSINESNVDIGYTKVYRALLETTGKFNIYYIYTLPLLRAEVEKHILEPLSKILGLLSLM